MKLALNTVTIQPAPLFTKIDATAAAGFTGIEFHVYEIYEYLIDGGSLADIKSKLADSGLEIPCMLGFRNWGDLKDHDYQLHLFEARRRLRVCHNLGCPILVCSTPMYDTDWSQLHTRFADLLQIGREENCTPSFEFIGHYASIKNIADSQTMLDRTEDNDATLVLDFFHAWNGGSSVEDIKSLPLNRIAHVHIDDAHPDIPQGQQDDSHRTLPGHGPIPLADYVSALKEKGYTGYLSVELFDPVLQNQDPFLTAQQARDSAAALLA
ncbi:MAG: sugar phosphate isomerase/epimerase [Verrucomicrobiota bacterium]